jgi:hypothetical protein
MKYCHGFYVPRPMIFSLRKNISKERIKIKGLC